MVDSTISHLIEVEIALTANLEIFLGLKSLNKIFEKTCAIRIIIFKC
jgi:hypothetical protein